MFMWAGRQAGCIIADDTIWSVGEMDE